VQLADEQTPSNIGPYWVFVEKLSEKIQQKKVDEDDKSTTYNSLSATSPILFSPITSKVYPGNHYCKLQSPMRLLEWVMTGSLKGLPMRMAMKQSGEGQDEDVSEMDFYLRMAAEQQAKLGLDAGAPASASVEAEVASEVLFI